MSLAKWKTQFNRCPGLLQFCGAFFDSAELSLQEISEQVGLYRPITATLVTTLKNEHPLDQDPKMNKYRLPFYCTASGKILLSYYGQEELHALIQSLTLHQFTNNTILDRHQLEQELAEAKKNEYACDNGALEMGLCCCAAPIFDYTHYPIAAISISRPCIRMGAPIREQMIADLKNSAQKITDLLVESKCVSSRNWTMIRVQNIFSVRLKSAPLFYFIDR